MTGRTDMNMVETLVAKGVTIPHPAMVTIDADVDPDRISGERVIIHPGARIRGARTVISSGAELGREGPVTVEDCIIGPDVQLKGGYAAKAVFLQGANLGLGHHVREGSILEEQAGGAHTVGLKQTILFPFVTLGSLINMCDCLMAGGTSRKNHSEVGSSYIHFNFTPTGDKATPSMFGDVARGVMLRERPIFLGGQGGTVGPARVAYGTVVGAGEILRQDVNEENQLVIPGAAPSVRRDFSPEQIRGAARLAARNVEYLAALDALEAWYRQARAPFFAAMELGDLVLEGALGALASARQERAKRLSTLLSKLTASCGVEADLFTARERLCVPECGGAAGATLPAAPEMVLSALGQAAEEGTSYVQAVQDLSAQEVQAGTAWLEEVGAVRLAAACALVPDLPVAAVR
ncbi:bifunctional N-acetylglucosamine-1-phosphate uridyltransferase/glucosamine-1-phosphate acetyltransferase [Dermatophilus congolensis]|uniref:Bifunctional N-acetylglucosamine-1-phosphate uridyltransferase/glucosamine-1-phosphate acetyltransferase n=1 Tax=Dermatophilus congolensis TaxID=1863 RepID=A0AA46BPR3_9MICO|nr:UDP-N-acetylglucosamine pyrophosphorylase [Dermatophilus congolensis]STD13630.1 bifunctional N-acetylglucosamine-1-phosphate uridyltransferase/glucosamine-1-phosphate acetyltransferase [Dermatophilus congolensis]